MSQGAEYVGVRDIAKHLGVSRNYVYQLVETGLPHYKLGQRFRFQISEVDAWMKEHRKEEE